VERAELQACTTSAPVASDKRNGSRHGNDLCTDFGRRLDNNTAERSSERSYGHFRCREPFQGVFCGMMRIGPRSHRQSPRNPAKISLRTRKTEGLHSMNANLILSLSCFAAVTLTACEYYPSGYYSHGSYPYGYYTPTVYEYDYYSGHPCGYGYDNGRIREQRSLPRWPY